jgi:ABC-type uncharacterized transport system ATPase subunit
MEIAPQTNAQAPPDNSVASVSTPAIGARGGLGYVPQEREVFPSLTVIENLTVGARPGDWDLRPCLHTVSAPSRTASSPRWTTIWR